MAEKIAVPVVDKVDYGLDAPKQFRSLITRGIVLFLLGLGFYVMNRTNAPGGGLALFIVFGLIGLGHLAAAGVMYWSSRTGKLQVRDQILNELPWRGDEKVLDVGCGRGLLLIGAAKRLSKAGKATGVDIWSDEDLSDNRALMTLGNAKAEDVIDRVRVEESDARRLPYQPNSFDTVLSSLAIHNLKESDEREKAVLEMLRVLKPGGHLAIFDVLHTGEYLHVAERNGAELVKQSGLSFLWCLPTRWFVARKKA
jgi:SAM-dependent methyltransferase